MKSSEEGDADTHIEEVICIEVLAVVGEGFESSVLCD